MKKIIICFLLSLLAVTIGYAQNADGFSHFYWGESREYIIDYFQENGIEYTDNVTNLWYAASHYNCKGRGGIGLYSNRLFVIWYFVTNIVYASDAQRKLASISNYYAQQGIDYIDSGFFYGDNSRAYRKSEISEGVYYKMCWEIGDTYIDWRIIPRSPYLLTGEFVLFAVIYSKSINAMVEHNRDTYNE